MHRQRKKMACICSVYIMHFKIAWNVSKLIVFFIYLKYWWHIKCTCNGFTHEPVLQALFWCLSNKGKEFVPALPAQRSCRDNSHFSLRWSKRYLSHVYVTLHSNLTSLKLLWWGLYATKPSSKVFGTRCAAERWLCRNRSGTLLFHR